MTKHAPPVPPANRSPKGTGDATKAPLVQNKAAGKGGDATQRGQQGNIRQNTTNQGLQQDR